MTDNLQNSPANSAPNVNETQFLAGTETAEKDALYKDFFQTNENGEITGNVKTKRSALEISANILTFVTPLFLLGAVIFGVHTFVKSQENSTFTEHFPFLCSYINSGIHLDNEEKGCKTSNIIAEEYNEKTKQLSQSIVNQLSIYIPIKVASGEGSSSPTEEFIRHTYKNKINVNTILDAFEQQKLKFQPSRAIENIVCKNFSFANEDTLSVQCDVYGSALDDINTTFATSRMEATKFIE